MPFPSFDEFYESIQGEQMQSLLAQCVASESIEFQPFTNEGISVYTGTVLRMSMRISIKLLEYYHDWLSQQMLL